MSIAVGPSRNALFCLQFFSRLSRKLHPACHFLHSHRCLSSSSHGLECFTAPHVKFCVGSDTHPSLSVRSQWAFACLAQASQWKHWGLCMGRTGSDLNPNYLLVFFTSCVRGSIAVMSPTFRLATGQPAAVPSGMVSRKKVCKREIRGPGSTSFILRFHVPTRVLKFSRENHVDSVNWTTDSGLQWIASADWFDSAVETRCGGRCRTPRPRIVFGISNSVSAPVTLS